MKNEIRYIDLFGGVGGFRLGIERATNLSKTKRNESRRNEKDSPKSEQITMASKQFTCVFYCDNDKYAVQTYNKNFNENYEPTDIRTIKADSLPDFDWLCGGFPCQAFSIAGKRRGFEDTRGTLFFEIARIIKAKRPKIVFLENVKGLLNHEKGNTFRTIIQTLSELGYDVQWMVLNSKFFGVPQNRERVFIIGSLRGTSRPEILPFRQGSKEINQTPEQISSTIHKGYYKQGGRDKQYIPMRKEIDNKGRITERNDGISFTLSGSGRNSGRNLIIPQGQRVYGTEGQSVSIKSEGGGQGAKTGLYIMDLYNKKIHSDRSPTLTEPHHNTLRVLENMKIRRLTPIECERLQGFPDNWTEGVSDTQRYKQMGNAVTVNVIQAIAERLFK